MNVPPNNPNSELATTRHWQDWYSEELLQFTSNGALGEEWYGNNQHHVLEWIDDCWEQWSGGVPRKDATVLDLGTGNGLFTLRLGGLGFKRIYGIDYLANAIDCARQFSEAVRTGKVTLEDCDFEHAADCQYAFGVDDIMSSSRCADDPSPQAEVIRALGADGIDLLHDKGTLDVFYLRSQLPEMIKRVAAKYAANPSCVWVISSGNLTPDELAGVVSSNSDFKEIDRMRTLNEYHFGGATGLPLSTVCFAKR